MCADQQCEMDAVCFLVECCMVYLTIRFLLLDFVISVSV